MMNKAQKLITKYNKELIILIIIIALSLFTVNFINIGNDYWWHIKAGKYMLENHTILKHDIFSWFAIEHNLSWISHEWLTEIILYGLKILFNDNHIIVYCLTLWLSIMIDIFLSNRKKMKKNIYFSVFFLLLSLVFLGMNVMPRPHMFSFLFLTLTLTLLFNLLENENSNKIFFLPLIALIWSNTHGGSSNLSYILCFLFFFIGNFQFSFSKFEAKPFTKLQLRKYLLVTILCILAIIINPHGIKMLLYPYQNMQDSFMLKTISEWQPSNPNQLSHLAIFAFIGYLMFIILKSEKKLQLLDFLLLAMFGFLSLKSIRFWPFLYLTSFYVIFDYVKEKKTSNITNNILLGVCCLFLISYNILIPNKTIFSVPLDDSFIAKIKEENPKRLYNYYDYGGYLIYNDIKVFIDGRADLYSKYNYRDSYHLINLQGDYRQILNHYQFDMFLLDKGIPLAFYLKENENYEIVLEKNNTVLYKLK